MRNLYTYRSLELLQRGVLLDGSCLRRSIKETYTITIASFCYTAPTDVDAGSTAKESTAAFICRTAPTYVDAGSTTEEAVIISE